MKKTVSPFSTLNIVGTDYSEEFILTVQNRLSDFMKKSKMAFSENTHRARVADFKIYKAWCDDRKLIPVPAHPENIEKFIWDSVADPDIDENTGEILFDNEGDELLVQIRSVATIERYLATIKYLHEASREVLMEYTGMEDFNPQKYRNPVDTLRVKLALRTIKRRFRTRPQRQAQAMRLDLVNTILEELDNSLRHTLYKALVSVAFDSMLRCSELVRIEMDHLTINDDGSGKVFIPFHKSDQEGEGGYRYLSSVSVELIHNWSVKARITSGLLFRSVDRAGIVLDSMHKGRVAKIYKNVGRLSGADVSKLSAHSTRVGAAQELLSNGASLPALMVAGDWKSSAMPVRYAQKINVETGAMSELSKSRGRS